MSDDITEVSDEYEFPLIDELIRKSLIEDEKEVNDCGLSDGDLW